MYSVLLISHSSEKTGGGEDDFERLAEYLHDKYILYGVFPVGFREKRLNKYFKEYQTTKLNVFPFDKLNGPIRYLSYFLNASGNNRLIESFIKNKTIDCAFINSSAIFSVLKVLKKNKIPSIISIKEVIKPNFIRNFISSYINKRASSVIVISNYLKDKVKNNIDDNLINIVYCAIEEFPPEILNLQILNDDKTQNKVIHIVNIGVIGFHKGQDILLDAVKSIQDVGIIIDFIGRIINFKYYQLLLRKSKNLPENIKVVFKGELSKFEVYKEIVNSNVVVVTSLEEGFSLVTLEAMMLNKLVVSSDVGISKEIIINKKNGFVFRPGSYYELRNILKEIAEDTSIIRLISKDANKNLENRFDLLDNLKKTNNIIFNTILKNQ